MYIGPLANLISPNNFSSIAFIKTVLINYEGSDGKQWTWEAVERCGCDGIIIIVPITTENELILIKQYRAVLDRRVLELPAGLVDEGENMESACARELIEETAHASDNIEPLIEGVVSTGINSETWHVFLARDVRPATSHEINTNKPDGNEDIEVVKVPLDKAYEHIEALADEGLLVDIRIHGMLELARRRLARSEEK